MTEKIHRIGVLTGGGDCPGLNAVIRVVTKAAITELGLEVLGIEDGKGQSLARGLNLIRGRIIVRQNGIEPLLGGGAMALGVGLAGVVEILPGLGRLVDGKPGRLDQLVALALLIVVEGVAVDAQQNVLSLLVVPFIEQADRLLQIGSGSRQSLNSQHGSQEAGAPAPPQPHVASHSHGRPP